MSDNKVYNLRYKNPEYYPVLGKFIDKINFDEFTSPLMYRKDEEIKEENIIEPEIKDSEYWKRKKKLKKTKFTKKSVLAIEDSKDPVMKRLYEGQLCNLNLNSEIETGRRGHKATSQDAPYKYVLLQVIKKDQSSSSSSSSSSMEQDTEINIIPVSDWFRFNKQSSYRQEKFLDEIDDQFDAAEKEKKKKRDRYNKLFSADDDKQAGNLESKELLDEQREKKKKNSIDITLGSRGARSAQPAPLFGRASTDYLKKLPKTKSVKASNLNEAGIDMDEVYQHSANFAGDHDQIKADDEDDVGGEQMELEINEDINSGMKDENDELDINSDDEEDDDEDEEDIIEGESMDTSIRKPILDTEAILNRPLKRMRNGDEDGIEDEQPTVRPRTTYDLNEESIRRFIKNKGGRVSIESIKEEFKQQIKAYNDIHGKGTGSKKFIDLVLPITITIEDPLLGNVLALKS